MKLQDYYSKYEKLTTKKNLSGEEALKAVKQDGYALKYVKDINQTEAVCLEAVKKDGDALKYVNSSFFKDVIN